MTSVLYTWCANNESKRKVNYEVIIFVNVDTKHGFDEFKQLTLSQANRIQVIPHSMYYHHILIWKGMWRHLLVLERTISYSPRLISFFLHH